MSKFNKLRARAEKVGLKDSKKITKIIDDTFDAENDCQITPQDRLEILEVIRARQEGRNYLQL